MARIDEQALVRLYELCKIRGCLFEAITNETNDRKIIAERVVLARRMYTEGYPTAVIARAIDIPEPRVRAYAHKKGVKDMVIK